MLVIVDYGVGNVNAFANIFKKLNVGFKIASSPSDLEGAEKIILPGVGAFDWAMGRLNASGMREPLDELVQEQKKPTLGVCVGMQMMAHKSDEGELPGLGWIDAEVKLMCARNRSTNLQLPHMGWNDVTPVSSAPLFANLDKPRFYFLHSYYFKPSNMKSTIATTQYHDCFTSAASNEHIIGVQFHPEKSHGWGIHLLKNFLELDYAAPADNSLSSHT